MIIVLGLFYVLLHDPNKDILVSRKFPNIIYCTKACDGHNMCDVTVNHNYNHTLFMAGPVASFCM